MSRVTPPEEHSVEQSDANDYRKFMTAMLIVAIGLLVYGAYCLVVSPRVRDEAKRLPRMTCAQLAQNGPGPNRFIALTDACLNLGGSSVTERDGETGAFEMYHPLYAADLQQEPQPREFRLILGIMDETERRRIRDDGNKHKQLGKPGLSELTGAVTKGGALPPWVQKGFAEKYPGIRLDNCWVLTVGGYEPTSQRAERLQWHGIGCTLAATALILGWWFWRCAVPKRLPVQPATTMEPEN